MLDRYHRQMLLSGIGREGQERLGQAHALIVGCGALGSVAADGLARAGVGRLTLVDRDVVELTNLQRQVLYDEGDLGMPKAEAARRRLARVNSQVSIEARVEDFNHRNAERLADESVDILIDGLDNFETRYLLNDLAVSRHLPYVYGGAVGTTGLAMTILPHPAAGDARRESRREGRREGLVRWTAEQSTACLRCIFPDAPPPGTTPTCDTAGVLGAVVLMIAAHQTAQAIKLLAGAVEAVDRSLLWLEVWANQTQRFELGDGRRPDCPCCALGEFAHLEGESARSAITLCGRNAVQIAANEGSRMDLEAMAIRLAPHGRFRCSAMVLHGTFANERSPQGEPVQLTLFADGRAILVGTTEPETARAIYARYVGI